MLRSIAITLLLYAVTASSALAQSTIEGFTEPFHKVALSPAEPGILMEVLVQEGDVVKAGDKLAVLDTRVLDISLKIARQAMQSRGRQDAAKAERDLRAQRLTRLQSLRPQGYAFQDELDRAAADLSVAEANLLSAEEQIAIDTLEFEKTQAMLDLRTMRSPIDGIIAKVHREPREFVTTVEPVVFTIVQLDPLRVIFAAPTADAIKLRRDQAVTVRFPETGDEAVGRIELVSPITDAESGMVRVKVLIANPKVRYRCGVHCLLLPNAGSLNSRLP